MTFGNSVKTCFNKYATFSGRASRSEYWWFVLFQYIVMIAWFILLSIFFGLPEQVSATAGADSIQASALLGGMPIAETILFYALGLVFFLPSLAVCVRRLHDTGRSGAWWFISLVPCVGSIILLVFMLMESAPDNRYGPNELYHQYMDQNH